MKNTKIGYCDNSVNVVSGCRHTCPYCYARRIATRFGGCDPWPRVVPDTNGNLWLDEPVKVTRGGKTQTAPYPLGFTPTFHAYRLKELEEQEEGKTVFVCSMADLFGRWVPNSWILRVFESCEKSKARFLFLTKNPQRYRELDGKGLLPKQHWYGTTVTTAGGRQPFMCLDYHTWISFEPLQNSFPEDWLEDVATRVDWAVIGAETGNRKGKVVPKAEWVTSIFNAFRMGAAPVYMKESLLDICGEIVTQTPWGPNYADGRPL